jgi:hypothetical protein
MWCARLTKSHVPGINSRRSLIGHSKHLPPTHGTPLIGGHLHNACLITVLSNISTRTRSGAFRAPSAPFQSNPLARADMTKEGGQDKEYLQISSHHLHLRDSTLLSCQPTIYLMGSLMANPNPPSTSTIQPSHHIIKAYM